MLGFDPYDFRMQVKINGEPRDVPDGQTLEGLLRSLSLHDKPCAAEVNRRLVPRRDREGVVLRSGDVVELVTLVGGG